VIPVFSAPGVQHLASAAKAARTVESRPPEKSKPTVAAAPVAPPKAQLLQNIHWYVLELFLNYVLTLSYIMFLMYTTCLIYIYTIYYILHYMFVDVHHLP
jgi:hypothetical protein